MSVEVGDRDEQRRIPTTKRRTALQWNLQTLLLVTAVVAVWIGYWRYRRELPLLLHEIETMQQMARELVVHDPDQVAVVKLHPLWMNDERWDVYLPQGTYLLRMATRDVDKEGLAPVVAEAPVSAGRHRVELLREKDGEGWKITVLVDGQPAIEAVESADWYPGRGSVGSGGFSGSEQLPPDIPVEFQRTRFTKPTQKGSYEAPPGPTEGLLLWIERVGNSR